VSVQAFFDALPFTPDPFQVIASEAVEAGSSVVVTAPTGAGKTLVAEACVDHAIQKGKRAFYTTPLKALSNQKFRDFVGKYGPERVGLLTGDNSINGDASVVIMTTEVLRNMIYAGTDLSDVEIVVLDEVHYLQDRFRGAVWEEVIIHAPPHIRMIALSATIANPGEFTDWVRERRGPTELVIEQVRPVPLESWWAVRDLDGSEEVPILPMFIESKKGQAPNPAIPRLLSRQRGRRRRFATPRRLELVDELGPRSMLPAIYFVFSRAGCDDAANAVVSSGIRLTTSDESDEVLRRAEAGTEHLAQEDLAVLDYGTWITNLQAGVAAHHAGLVPAFKEVVEDLFARGLVKLVFATETLALGINMPARTVVLDKLSKFTGEGHELLLPGEFTQLTGRAGRRGIDTIGHGIVLHSPYVPFERVTLIATAGSHPMTSSFRPTYNMVANLIANYERERAEELLRASFAQFQNDRSLSRLTAGIRKNERRLEKALVVAEDGEGDVWAALEEHQTLRPDNAKAVTREAEKLRVGAVIDVQLGSRTGRYVIVGKKQRNAGVMFEILRSDGERSRIRARDVPAQTTIVGSVSLPHPFPPPRDAIKVFAVTLDELDVEDARPLLQQGHYAPGRAVISVERLAAARNVRRLQRELERQQSRSTEERAGLVGELARVLDILDEWGFQKDGQLTASGEALRVVYSDKDLLFVECITRGLFNDLTPPELAGLISSFVYESRLEESTVRWPTPLMEDRWSQMGELWDWLTESEGSHALARTRPLDPGFGALAYWWASGTELDVLLGEDDLAAGDFVRTTRSVLDMTRQFRDAAPALGAPELASGAREALEAMDRGVVAAGGAT
jgi:ATP-dependent RNA helicase HelY